MAAYCARLADSAFEKESKTSKARAMRPLYRAVVCARSTAGHFIQVGPLFFMIHPEVLVLYRGAEGADDRSTRDYERHGKPKLAVTGANFAPDYSEEKWAGKWRRVIDETSAVCDP